MIQFLLALFRPFRVLIERSGADYDQFIRILELKLTMDNRKQNRRRKGGDQSLVLQSMTQIFMGFAFAVSLVMIRSEFTFFYMMHMVIMVMMAMMIISEFTTILFDTSENAIIQPLPIKGNTISLARNAHVFLYLTLIAFNMSLATVIVAFVKFGLLSGLLFLLSVVLNVTFTLFFANILYLGLMHIASGEQLKTILMYFQIGIAVLFMAGYQFGLQMVDRSHITDFTLSIHWYTHLIPPAVFSGFIESLSTGNFDSTHVLFVVEALCIPFAALYLTTRFLTPLFNRKLLNLEHSDRATKVKTGTGKTTIYYRLMERLFTRSNEEKAAFQLSWRMSGYERLFKQSFFPSLAYVLIMIVVQFFGKDINFADLVHSSRYLLVLYSFLLICFTLTASLLLGNNKNAEWIFFTLPVQRPADYFKGFIKAVFARFFIPFYVLLSAVIVGIWGVRVIPDIVIAWLVIYFCTLMMYCIQPKEFPFSQQKNASQGGKNMIKVFGLIILAAILGFAHYFISKWEIGGHVVLIVFYTVAVVLANRIWAYKLVQWDNIDCSEF